MKSPYEILGVSPNASDDEIKKAYRALVRKYHPDKYRDSDLADLANEKMKEINAAYEEIQKMRSGKSSDKRGNNYNGNPHQGSGDSRYAEVRRLINNNNIRAAEQILRGISPAEQNAEWAFLMGCVLFKRGYFLDAQQMFDRACSMDPHNVEYRNACDQIRMQTHGYGGGYRQATNTDQACSCCTNLCVADCCCELMGGDLIRCL